MRTSRVSLVGTVIVALLVGVGAVVVSAQEQASQPSGETPAAVAPTAAYVHGTGTLATCCGDEVETFDAEGQRLTLRNMEVTGTYTFDDPRLSGTFHAVQGIDEYPQADSDRRVEIGWGEMRIENDGGAWSGTTTGTYDSEKPTETSMAVWALTGEGGYAGLSALLFDLSTTGSPPYFAGAIFAGPLPPR